MSAEFGSRSVDILTIIREYRAKGYIKETSPHWWSTDYEPDPREYVSFDEFENRLVSLGKIPTRKSPLFAICPGFNDIVISREAYVYRGDQVPITTLDLEIDGCPLQFLVTARPYTPKENFSRHTYVGQIDACPSISSLQSFIAQGGEIDLLDHFFPHIRGLLASQRGNHYFWYELTYNWRLTYEKQLELALKKKGLSYLHIYSHTFLNDKTYLEVWEELEAKQGLVDQRKTCWPDFPHQTVSVEEFIQGYKTEKQDLVVYYPLRVSGFRETLPLFIAARTGLKSQERKPVVLGIYAENGCTGFCRRGGILRIKKRELALEISSLISQDFGFQVDTILFTPHPGRPLYERVAGY